MSKRRFKRFTRRLETEFSSGGLSFKGISSDISERGMFIRTQHGFVPGTRIDIKLYLPDGSVANLKGIVRRTIKTPHHFIKNGMGVELTEVDNTFENFLSQELIGYERASTTTESSQSHGTEEPEYVIVSCPSCGVKNRVRHHKHSVRIKCGRCGTYLG